VLIPRRGFQAGGEGKLRLARLAAAQAAMENV